MVKPVVQIAVLIGLFTAVIGALNILAHGSVPRLAVRSQISAGTILAAREPYRDSPFVVDHFFERTDEVDLFEGNDASQSLAGDAERSYRIFLAGPAALTLVTRVTRSDQLPRMALYNDANQLVDGGEHEVIGGRIVESFEANASGLYRIQTRFPYSDVERITLAVRIDDPVETYAAYLDRNLKGIELDFLPSQWDRLEEIRRSRRAAEPIADVRWQPLFQSRERVQARIRSANGPWSLATVGLAGRNHAHHSAGLLPSIDVRIVSGSLPYGLQRFKLYGLRSKNHGRDMAFESVLRDYGVLMPRADIVKVSVGNDVQFMESLEGMKPFLFEYAQRNEGAITGFNADVLVGDANSRFEHKEFYKKGIELDTNRFGSMASPVFAQAIDVNAMGLVHAFALSYGGKHGLGQADFRFHANPRTDRIAPMVRDFNSTAEGDPYFDPVNAFRNTLVELADYAPEWRPNVVTHGSFFIERAESNTDLDEFFWWTSHPATLQFFAQPGRFESLAKHMDLLQSPLALEHVASRQENVRTIARMLASDRLGKALDTSPTQRRYVDYANGRAAFGLDDVTTDGFQYVRELVEHVSDGAVVLSESSLQQLAWRNASVSQMHEYAIQESDPNDVAHWHELQDAPNDVITYLHGTETHDRTLLTFVQRNLAINDGTFVLVGGDGQEYEPVRDALAGTRIRPLQYRDLYLTDIQTNERVRTWFYSIPKTEAYQNLHARVTGSIRYLGPRNISLNPAFPLPDSLLPLVDPDTIFEISDDDYRMRDDAPPIDAGLVIPRKAVLHIDNDSELRFGESGYLIVRGGIRVAESASLTLTADGDSWPGVHFHNNPDLDIRNVVVKNVGDGAEFVDCDGRRYTGGVSFFDSNVRLDNVRIENARVEDALHFLRCEAEVTNLTIENSMSDAIDADFSVLNLTDTMIRNSGGDGVDVSGSLLKIDGARISSNVDKNISAGENSVVHIRHAELSDATYGVAAKDGSTVRLNDSTIERNRYGISSYAKKPVFGKPSVSIGDGVRIRNNRENTVSYDPAIVQQ
jgi:hypothetical protein